jgi:tetratricopeptide (TPR) repeat protein
MKKYMIMACMIAATTVFAQKRELRKVEKAVESGNLAEAQEIFQTINENEVEDKYKGQYLFYKAASVSGMIEQRIPSYEEIVTAEKLIAESEELGYEDEKLMPLLKQSISSMKIQVANKRLQAGDIPGGLKIIDELYQADTSNKDMLMTSAQLSYQSKDFKGAMVKFQELFDLGYTGQKTEYFAVNKETNTIEKFNNAKLRDVSVSVARTHSDPTQESTPSQMGFVVNNLVWLYKNDGQLEKAKFIFQKAEDRFPDDSSLDMAKPEIYNNLGMMKEYEEAVKKLENATKDPKVYDNLGTAALKGKNYDQAIEYLSKSLSINPKNFISQVNLSNAYIEKGNLEETTAEEQETFYKNAIEHLELAHNIKPDDVNVMNTLVSLYGAFSMTEKADAIKAKM